MCKSTFVTCPWLVMLIVRIIMQADEGNDEEDSRYRNVFVYQNVDDAVVIVMMLLPVVVVVVVAAAAVVVVSVLSWW